MPSSTPAASLYSCRRAGARIGLLQALAVIDPHLGEQRRVLVPPQPRQHREARQHLQRRRRAGRRGEFGAADQLVVDLLLFGDPQAVRHLDDVDAVDEGFVVAVVLEGLPLRLVGVGQDDALERDGADVLGADVVAFLRRGQQRVQHLDRRLEHLDELEQSLVGAIEAAGIAVGVRDRSAHATPACGYRPCRQARRCPGCSRRPVRSWRRRSGAAATASASARGTARCRRRTRRVA